jgi:hypothetical protein
MHGYRVFENNFSLTVLTFKFIYVSWGWGEACIGFWWGNLTERDHRRDPDVDRMTILRWIFRKWDVGVWPGLSWLRIETGGGTCECGNKLSGYIEYSEFLD